MKIEQIRQMLIEGTPVIGSQVVEMRSSAIAEMYSAIGFDFILIDQEHSAIDLSEAAEIIRVARLCRIAPFVRIPEIAYSAVTRPLDQGAQGIVVPRVTCRDQVLEVLDMMKYHPQGHRGAALGGPSAGYRQVNPREFVDRANGLTMLVIQVESESAVREIDKIITVPGVDVALVGPSDLSLSAGCVGDFDDDLVVSLIQTVIDKCKAHGVTPGLAGCSLDLFRNWICEGMKFFWVGNDVSMIMTYGRQVVENLRECYRQSVGEFDIVRRVEERTP
ncbi:MAG: hypothetical protein HYX78_08630 [Armatimonadetes bacterium]|nr:hypothetical protein [Armatimonadota bacterium]